MLSKKTSVELWFIIVRIGRMVRPRPSADFMSTMKVESPSVFFATSPRGVVRASSSIRSECSARLVQIFWPLTMYLSPSFLAKVRSAVVSVPLVGSVTPKACRRSSPVGDLRQVALLLVRAAVLQDGAHDVHLGVAGAGIAAGAVDLLEDRRGRRQRQAGAAEFLGDQRAEVAGLGQGGDEGGRVGAVTVHLAPVLAGEAGAELADFLADLGMRIGGDDLLVHGVSSGFGIRAGPPWWQGGAPWADWRHRGIRKRR